jgi:tetratricopeptide (TPR) repeat protein
MNLAQMTPQQARLRLSNGGRSEETCLKLAQRSFDARYGDASEMLAWAKLAMDLLPSDAGELTRGTCLAHFGNALRVSGSFTESRDALTLAAALVPREPLVHEFYASLLESVRDFPSALGHLEAAATLRKGRGEREGQTKVLLQLAMLLDLLGKSSEAAMVVDSVLNLIDDEDLARAAAQTLVLYLANAGSYVRALRMLASAEPLFARGKDLFRLKVEWLRSKIYAGLGDDTSAMESWKAVRNEYGRRGMAQEVALVSLEMGVQHARRGRYGLACAEAAYVHPLLVELGIERDAETAALLRRVAGRRVRSVHVAQRLSDALIAIRSRVA